MPLHEPRHGSAGFQTCCIADFQIGKSRDVVRPETRDTADLEVCATVQAQTRHARRLHFCANRQLILLVCFLFACSPIAFALGDAPYVDTVASHGAFPIVQNNSVAAIDVDTNDFDGVLIAVR